MEWLTLLEWNWSSLGIR